jgi:hypothetical protein
VHELRLFEVQLNALITVDFKHEPRGASYRALIDFVVPRFPACLLVLRSEMPERNGITTFRSRMKNHLLSEALEAEWPGTRLLGAARARVLRYALNVEAGAILMDVSSGLYAWRQPGLPEDFCVLRDDGSAWLTTISHERDAYLTLTDAELVELREQAPEVLHCLAR